MNSLLPQTTEVLVVGAGPAGMVTALSLTVRGVHVTIVDALPLGQNGSRAAMVHAHTLEELETLGMAAPLLQVGIKSKALTFRDPRERPLVSVKFGELRDKTRFPMTLLVSQRETEKLLEKRLGELGVQVHRGVKIASISPEKEGQGIVAKLESGDHIVTKYVVGTDGSKSIVRADAGIKLLDPHTHAEPVHGIGDRQLVLADIFIRDPLPTLLREPEGVPLFGPDGITFLVPLPSPAGDPRHYFRFVASLPQDAPPPPSVPTVEYLQDLLDRRGPGARTNGVVAKVDEVVSGSRYRTRSARVDKYMARMGGGFVLLAGDAAHIHSPAGGQGMNLGLCDGILLGKAIAEHILLGNDAVLEKYARDRKAVAGRVIKVAEGLTNLANVKGFWKLHTRNAALRIIDRIPGIGKVFAWRISGLAYVA